jgi:lipopolysaccharide biosynthesis glycosyltransferase
MTDFEQEKLQDANLRKPDLSRDRGMEVLCASDERYLPHAATMLCSLLEHNRVSRIHYFYSTVASEKLAKLKSLATRFGSELVCYEIVPATFEALRVDKWASAAVYYRLLAPRLLPADLNKILYLDSDIIVRGSLSDLWSTDLTNHALAAVPDYWQDAKSLEVVPVGEKLFNSGVLLINLQAWRQNSIPEKAIAFIRENPEKVQFWDQEALNAVLAHQWIELPVNWNAQGDRHWQSASGNGTATDPAIVHFIMSSKPWQWSNEHPFKPEYHKYRLQTPWRQYEQEGKPGLPQRLQHSLRRVVRNALPGSLRQWLRTNVMSPRA